jgi:hypothetical protein
MDTTSKVLMAGSIFSAVGLGASLMFVVVQGQGAEHVITDEQALLHRTMMQATAFHMEPPALGIECLEKCRDTDQTQECVEACYEPAPTPDPHAAVPDEACIEYIEIAPGETEYFPLNPSLKTICEGRGLYPYPGPTP